MAGKRTKVDHSRLSTSLWRTTIERLRHISDQTGKPQTMLADEAIDLLEAKYLTAGAMAPTGAPS